MILNNYVFFNSLNFIFFVKPWVSENLISHFKNNKYIILFNCKYYN